MAEQPRKRCLYDVLGVNRDCSQEEIRSAYKRLALQLHPDKLAQSGGGGADATAAFQELLHAYEVLSDPKERAWYDSHRSQILFSDPSSASKSNSSFFDVDLFSFFSKSMFNGYTDSGKGFFKVYGDVFSKIYSQELYFTEQVGLPSDAVAPSPLIGNLDSPYSQVTAFYNYWLGFCTVLDFVWVDEYDSSAGVNRRSRRVMEDENKKVRKKARREYNETVRGLAAFAKKRDKRVLDMQMKRTMEEEKRRSEDRERKKEEDRKRMERAMMYQEPEWAKNDEEKEEFWDDTEEDKRRKNGKGVGELYCVVCNKKFKSDKQWKNHEQSKKHREKVAELQTSFAEEDEALKDFEEELTVSFDYEPPPEDDGSDADPLCEEFRDALELQEEEDEEVSTEDADSKLETDDESDILEAMVSGRKSRKNQYMNIDDLPANEHVTRASNDDEITNSMENYNRKSRRNGRGKSGTSMDTEVRDAGEGSSGSQREDSDVHIHENNVERRTEDPSCPVEDVSEIHKGDQAVVKNHKIKKQQSNGKEPAKKDTISSKNSSKGKKQKAAAKAPSNSCETCGEIFESRNKLFAHLGKTGHSMLKSREICNHFIHPGS